jgi:hypothetical protein
MHAGQACKPGNSWGIFCRKEENLRLGFYPALTETGFRLVLALSESYIGVSVIGQYEIKKIDSDYFDNE